MPLTDGPRKARQHAMAIFSTSLQLPAIGRLPTLSHIFSSWMISLLIITHVDLQCARILLVTLKAVILMIFSAT